MRALSADLEHDDRRPYFLWDEDTTIAELRAALAGDDVDERERLLGKMLREARDTDVWRFTTPQIVADTIPRLGRHLGRRRPFWEWLIGEWRARGVVT